LLFDSGELPDAFFGHGILDETADIVKYGSKGLLVPLEDYIERDAPNVRRLLAEHPEYKKLLTAPDGHIYSLPTLNEAYPLTKPALFINKQWLDRLDLPVPRTTDEFLGTLEEFKNRDMNGNGLPDEIPFSFMANNRNTNLASMFGSFGIVDRPNHLTLEDGKVVYTTVLQEYKQAIEYFHLLFQEGLADPEAFTQDNKVYSAKIGKQDVVGSFIAWNTNSVGLKDDNDYIPLPPLAGPDGGRKWAGFEPGILFKGSFAVTSANRHPDLTMRWIDYMYDPTVSLQAVHGMIGTSLTALPIGGYQVVPVPRGIDPGTFRGIPETSRTVWAVTKEMEDSVVSLPRQKLSKTSLDKLYKPYLVFNEYPKIYFTAEENDRISRYMTDITTYADKMYAKWLISGGIGNEWNEYLQRLNDMGLESLIEIYQTAYDRYRAENNNP
jgi:putative aldouronate transport system substrate-binding protein